MVKIKMIELDKTPLRSIPDRRKHGCDCCYKNVPTELFLGYRRQVLWFCSKCYIKLSKGIKKTHFKDIWSLTNEDLSEWGKR